MKNKLILAALLFFFTGVSAIAQVNVVLKKKTLNIGGAVVSSDWRVSTIENKLGKAERTREGYNQTHTYDKLGIVVFESMVNKVRSGNISEIQMHFYVPEPNEVTPKGTFSGAIKIDKLKVTQLMTPAYMKSKLKGWFVGESYMEHSYRMSNNGFYIYFQFNDEETGLNKVSIGKSTKAEDQ